MRNHVPVVRTQNHCFHFLTFECANIIFPHKNINSALKKKTHKEKFHFHFEKLMKNLPKEFIISVEFLYYVVVAHKNNESKNLNV